MPREGVEAAIDAVVSAFLTGLSSMPARIGKGDVHLRRLVEKEIYIVRQLVSRTWERRWRASGTNGRREDDSAAADDD